MCRWICSSKEASVNHKAELIQNEMNANVSFDKLVDINCLLVDTYKNEVIVHWGQYSLKQRKRTSTDNEKSVSFHRTSPSAIFNS